MRSAGAAIFSACLICPDLSERFLSSNGCRAAAIIKSN
jgi:hypothetical protein